MDGLNYVAAARVDEVPAGTAKVVRVGGREIAVVNDDGRFHAVANRCSHADQELACGRIRWGWIACPAHGARFDLETGEPLNPPATAPIAVYPVRVEDGTIAIAV